VTISFLDSWIGPITGRFKELIESYIKKLVPVINRILDLIPNKIYIPGTPLRIDLGIADNIQIKDNDFMYLPIAVVMQSDKNPFTEPDLAVFPNFTNSTYDLELAVSEYFIDSTLFELHKGDYIDIDTENIIGNRLTVNLVKFGTSGDFSEFEGTAPCKVVLKSLDPYPRVELNPVNSQFKGNFSMAVWCKKKNLTEEPFVYVLTLDTEVDTCLTLEIKTKNATNTTLPDIRLVVQINTLKIVVNGVIDTQVGPITYWKINLALAGALLVLEGWINVWLKNGWDVNKLLRNLLGLTHMYLKEMSLVEQDELLFARLTPGWNITWPGPVVPPANDPVKHHPHMLEL